MKDMPTGQPRRLPGREVRQHIVTTDRTNLITRYGLQFLLLNWPHQIPLRTAARNRPANEKDVVGIVNGEDSHAGVAEADVCLPYDIPPRGHPAIEILDVDVVER